jgi:hypothetical protein
LSNDFLVDSRFTDYEVEIITHAAQEWADATGSPDTVLTLTSSDIVQGEFTLGEWRTVDTHALMFKSDMDESGYVALKEERGHDFSGIAQTDEGGNIMFVSDAYTLSDGTVYWTELEGLALHEMGHHFGLKHGDGRIMIPVVDATNFCIDQASVDAFCELHPCSNPHSTCK